MNLIGVVQATPALFDKASSLNIVRHWTTLAAGKGCGLVLFPEAFIPGYPRGLDFGTVVGKRTREGKEQWRLYWENSMDVPGEETDLIGSWAKENGLYLIVGVSERDTISKTLYCTLLYFNPDGRLLGKHRKIKPTGSERIVWGEGDGSTLISVDSRIGKLGGLICWENYMPLARMAMYRKGVEIYLAPTADNRESWQHALQHIAVEGRCYVLGANQFVKRSDYPAALQSALVNDEDIMSRGGSVILSPEGEILAGPVYGREELLTAEYHPDEIVRNRMDFDVIGHYARDDIFSVMIRDQPETIRDR